MKHYTHIAGGLILAIIVAILTQFPITIMYLIVTGVSAIFIDLLEEVTEEHKRQFHNIFILIIPLIVMYFNMTIGLGILMGFISHLILDMWTLRGCPLLNPIRKERFIGLPKKHLIVTGSKSEKRVFALMIIVLFCCILTSAQIMPAVNAYTHKNYNTESSNYNVSTNSNLRPYISIDSNVNTNRHVKISECNNSTDIYVEVNNTTLKT